MAKKATPPAAPKAAKKVEAPVTPARPARGRLWFALWVALVTVAFILVLATVMAWVFQPGPAAQPTSAPTPTSTATASPTAQPTTAPTQAPTAQPTVVPGTTYPLASQEYTSPQGEAYNAEWDANGWLHQPNLPAGPERIAHELSFTIQPGNYAFNGVECQLFLDESRTGDGGKPSVGYGNGLPFTVSTADGREAWARVACRASEAGGFSIEWKP